MAAAGALGCPCQKRVVLAQHVLLTAASWLPHLQAAKLGLQLSMLRKHKSINMQGELVLGAHAAGCMYPAALVTGLQSFERGA